MTSSKFSQGALEFVEHNKQFNIVLIDGIKLSELMIEYNLGVSITTTYEIKKLDTDYFEEN
ncbi:MAG: hypothetical protein PVH88_27285 [Ignavibacteria bacterium]